MEEILRPTWWEINRKEIAYPFAREIYANDAVLYSFKQIDMILRAAVFMQHPTLGETEISDFDQPQEDEIPRPPIDGLASHKIPIRKRPNDVQPGTFESTDGSNANLKQNKINQTLNTRPSSRVRSGKQYSRGSVSRNGTPYKKSLEIEDPYDEAKKIKAARYIEHCRQEEEALKYLIPLNKVRDEETVKKSGVSQKDD